MTSRGPTLRDLILVTEAELSQSPHPERARLDAETLLLHLLEKDRAWLLAHSNDYLDQEQEQRYRVLIKRRRAGEPLQYITGVTEFFGMPFAVSPGVLIPRPETEHIVEEVLRLARSFKSQEIEIADIGTGSGAIAVAVANSLPSAKITATDISAAALDIARQNAKQNQVANRIEFFEGDLLAPLAGHIFQIVASNPPYVPTNDRDSLSVEVREYEPHLALFAKEDGLAIYRRLIPEAQNLLVPGGYLVLEIGYGQRLVIEQLMGESCYSDIRFINDYHDIPRVAVARKSN